MEQKENKVLLKKKVPNVELKNEEIKNAELQNTESKIEKTENRVSVCFARSEMRSGGLWPGAMERIN